MNSWERVVRTLNFENVDVLPTIGDASNRAVQEFYGGETLTEENKEEVAFRAALAIFDIAVGLPVIRTPSIQEYDGWITETQEWTGWIKKRPFLSSDDCLRDMKRFIDTTDPNRIDTEECRKAYAPWIKLAREFKLKSSAFGMYVDVGIQGAYHRYGLELFSYSYAENPDLVSKFIDTSSRYNFNKILPAIDPEFCPLFELGSDVAFKNGLLFPPQFLRKHYIPYLEIAANALHQKGIKAYVHSDGDVSQIIADIVATGIDGLHPIDPSAGMSIRKVRKRFPKLFILGGIDGRNMAFGTPEMVKKEVQQAIETAGPNYFVGVSGNIYEGIPVDNVKAMLGVVRGE